MTSTALFIGQATKPVHMELKIVDWMKVAIGYIYIFLLQINWFNIILPLGNSCYPSHQFSEISNSVPKKPLPKNQGTCECLGRWRRWLRRRWTMSWSETLKHRNKKNPSFEGVFVSVETTKFMEVLKNCLRGWCEFLWLLFGIPGILILQHPEMMALLTDSLYTFWGCLWCWPDLFKILEKLKNNPIYKTCYNSTNLIWFFPPYPRSKFSTRSLGAVKTPGRPWLGAK